MTDNKAKRGAPDRAKVAGGEDYEVDYLAKKLGVSKDAVKVAIQKVGNSRTAVEAELTKGKK